jgi:hypothetical protein
MHYRIGRGIVVKTENAAKPARQSSAHLRSMLAELPHVESSFDYGCGKLRYWKPLLETTDTLALVDSEIQLSRTQTLGGMRTSIRNLVSRSNRTSVQSEAEFHDCRDQFDRGFCINVLSVIPILAMRRKVLGTIRRHLKRGASCLFAVQYRNSDFDRMRAMPNASPWRDGFLVDSLRGHSFYGMISPDRLCAMLRRANFEIQDVQLNEGSVYAWVTPRPK